MCFAKQANIALRHLFVKTCLLKLFGLNLTSLVFRKYSVSDH